MIESAILPFAANSTAALSIEERIRRRAWHPEHLENARDWSWLWDSYEGGRRYRDAVYGTDSRGFPVRNLIRHPREYPTPREAESGTGPRPDYGQAFAPTSDPYESRRQRTPEPDFVREAIQAHLAKVLTREISRAGPPELERWWKDVDGRGTPIDDWIRQTVAPLLLLYGQLDLCCDHPRAPDGVAIATRADATAAGIDAAVAAHVDPGNLVWWELDWRGRYLQAVVRECRDDGTEVYRHWTGTASRPYRPDGKPAGPAVEHGFGRVPIERCFDARKLRCRHVGESRYMGVARLAHAHYNKDSELALADTTQAHPLPMGPEVYCQGSDDVPIGPGNVLPMAPIYNAQGQVSGYQAWQVLDFPKGASDSIRLNLDRLRDAADRSAHLTKPAGSGGTNRGSVSQSGISKQLDHDAGNRLCAAIAGTLRRAETALAGLALAVLLDRPPTPAELARVAISYPTTFDLHTADELAGGATDYQAILASAGETPEVETDLLRAIVRDLLPGRDDATYRRYDAEIADAVAARARDRAQSAEGTLPRFDTETPPGGADPPEPTEDE